MLNLVNEIVTQLNSLTYQVTIKSIRPSYSKSPPVYPMIIVDENNNSTRMALKGEERLANLAYQIDIFSKDMMVGTVPTSGVAICGLIGKAVDTALNSEYGLTRTSAVQMPDGRDSTISRLTLRYSGIIDSKTEYMYR